MKLNTPHILTLLTLCLSLSLWSQENQPKDDTNQAIQDFKELIKKSNNFKEYKVIEKVKINAVERKVSREIESLVTDITELNETIESKDQLIESHESDIGKLKAQVDKLQNQQNEIKLLGSMPLTKANYKIIMWSVITVLILLLLFFIFKFRRGHLINSEIKENLNNLEQEFDSYKHNALEKQQRLGRQLQDEKNKVHKLKNGNQ
ncbi:MAG: hypothetical protein ACTHY4_07575 [Flavobacteriaceae bacterium]|nr:hypothetical protein [Psychroflexus sp.]